MKLFFEYRLDRGMCWVSGACSYTREWKDQSPRLEGVLYIKQALDGQFKLVGNTEETRGGVSLATS